MAEIIVKLGQRVLQRYQFDKDVLNIGRARDNDIVIENLSVSRNHSRLKRQGGKFILIDMNSSNGTLVNGVRVTKTEVVHQDLITIGKHTLQFLNPDEEEDPTVEAGDGPATEAGGEPVAPTGSGTAPSKPAPQRTSSSQTSPPVTKPKTDYQPVGNIGRLLVSKGKQEGQEFRVFQEETTIGRAPSNDIRIHDWLVSNKHAKIRREGESYFISDLGSWRGTELSGEPLRNETPLVNGAEIVMGTTVLRFELKDASAIAEPDPFEPPESDIDLEEIEAQPSAVNFKIPEEFVSSNPEDQPVAITESSDEAPAAEAAKPPAELQPQEPEDDQPVVEVDPDDEFAPLTEDELEALDAEFDLYEPTDTEEAQHRRDIWEMNEQEKMFEGYEGENTFKAEESEHFSLIEDDDKLTRDERNAIQDFDPHDIRALQRRDDGEIADEEIDEEESLFGGSMTDKEPFGEPDSPDYGAPEKEDYEAHPEKAPAAQQTAEQNDPELSGKIKLWEKALKNKSKIIRKNAARELKKLTGKDYDWESEPSD